VNSQQDRTILCNLLPLKSSGFMGYDLRFQLAAVPGQAIYAPARRVVLRGSDAVVFVANSATDRWHENQQCFRSSGARGAAARPATIPMVMQYNKRPAGRDGVRGAQPRAELAPLPALRRGRHARRGVLETLPRSCCSRRRTFRRSTRRWRSRPAGRSRTGPAAISRCPARRSSRRRIRTTWSRSSCPGSALRRRTSARHPLKPRCPTSSCTASPTRAERHARRVLRPGLGRARRTRQRSARGARRRALASRGASWRWSSLSSRRAGEVEDRAQRILSILMRAADAAEPACCSPPPTRRRSWCFRRS
jgi:hypothetical protein